MVCCDKLLLSFTKKLRRNGEMSGSMLDLQQLNDDNIAIDLARAVDFLRLINTGSKRTSDSLRLSCGSGSRKT